MKGPGPPERPETRARWPQDGLNVGQVELRLPKISTSWLKMAKMSDKMRQDGGKMRKMKDVSSVLGPSGGYEHPPRYQEASMTAPRSP